jgi:carboxyl-terminal processing protease
MSLPFKLGSMDRYGKMNTKKPTLARKLGIVSILLVAVITVAPGYYTTSDFYLLETVKEHLKSDYVKRDLEDRELEYGAIKGMLKSLDDPYTRFVEPKGYKEMKVRMSGEFYGIGIHIGIRHERLTVIAPISGTPADKAGLKSLDRIMEIDGLSTDGMSLEEAVSKIRGKKGSEVILGIQRLPDKNIFDAPIVRDKIDIKAVDKKEVFEDKIGYIKLSTFESQKALFEFTNALVELKEKNIEALIVDLRSNGGGLLRNAISIASLLMDRGDVVHTVDRYGSKTTKRVSGRAKYSNKPLYVLVNEGSASASEILAGAIKDNDRGTIIGKQTFGKASVQKILNLPDGSAVLYTIAKYFTPEMTDITEKGIAVDIEVEIPSKNIEMFKDENYVYTYDTDPQLQEAIRIALNDLNG